MQIRKAWDAAMGRPTASAKPTGADKPTTAAQDAGWVHLVSADGTQDFGRGHLKTWMERPGSATPKGRQAQLESFRPSDIEPNRGDRAGIRPEAESAVYPVIIKSYDRSDRGAVVVLDWVEDDNLPAVLLETGGERSGEHSTTDRP